MKTVVKVQEVEKEGLMAFLDEKITIWGVNYIYSGKLVGVNDQCCKLEDVSVVFETGPFTTDKWQTAEKLPGPCYIMLSAIESFMTLK